ncbi:MAG: LD-carboxypeptidase [Clostridia bacterium]|nr:LD-carboxypeptidase [Clostridia bacterium]
MKTPRFIKPGDTIGFVAPSYGIGSEPYITRFEAAVRRFTDRGYKIKTCPSVFKADGIGISTDPKDAARDLIDIYLDPDVDAVISVGGGELMNETITNVDFSVFRDAEPKWYLGYSDNTNFLFPNLVLNDIPGIYGPCATGFGKEWEKTEEYAFALLEGKDLHVHGFDRFQRPDYETDDPLALYCLTEEKILSSYTFSEEKGRHVKADPEKEIVLKGILAGGCLDILENLSGTKYVDMEEFNRIHSDVIWCIEACDLTPMDIRRTLWHLKQQGWFESAKGFVIGRPLAAFYMDQLGVDRFNACTDVLSDLKVPLILDADIGHIDPMMPLILGSNAEIIIKGNDIDIRMSLD